MLLICRSLGTLGERVLLSRSSLATGDLVSTEQLSRAHTRQFSYHRGGRAMHDVSL